MRGLRPASPPATASPRSSRSWPRLRSSGPPASRRSSRGCGRSRRAPRRDAMSLLALWSRAGLPWTKPSARPARRLWAGRNGSSNTCNRRRVLRRTSSVCWRRRGWSRPSMTYRSRSGALRSRARGAFCLVPPVSCGRRQRAARSECSSSSDAASGWPRLPPRRCAGRDGLARELAADEQLGDTTAAELRACAQEEAGLQERLRKASEAVTGAEVRAQQVRDRAAEHQAELARLAERLGFDAAPAEEPLDEDARADLAARIERLARRREQLGPVNPLAKQEYEEARQYVEELEAQRRDLETALRELQSLIDETDQRIREAFETTFEAAAANFEEVVSQL